MRQAQKLAAKPAEGAEEAEPQGDAEASKGEASQAASPAKGTDAGAEQKDEAPSGEKGKTVEDWLRDQGQFSHMPKLADNWIRIKSKKATASGGIYYVNVQTGETTFKEPLAPLPEGWTKHTSRSTGKVYFYNAAKDLAQFDRPNE